MQGYGYLYCYKGNSTTRACPPCHSDRTHLVIPTAPTLSSRPHPPCHPDRTHLVIPTAVEGSHPVGTIHFDTAQDDRLGCHHVGGPSTSLRMTGLGAIPTAPTLSSRPHPPCHPDRSGGISSSRHNTLRHRSNLQA